MMSNEILTPENPLELNNSDKQSEVLKLNHDEIELIVSGEQRKSQSRNSVREIEEIDDVESSSKSNNSDLKIEQSEQDETIIIYESQPDNDSKLTIGDDTKNDSLELNNLDQEIGELKSNPGKTSENVESNLNDIVTNNDRLEPSNSDKDIDKSGSNQPKTLEDFKIRYQKSFKPGAFNSIMIYLYLLDVALLRPYEVCIHYFRSVGGQKTKVENGYNKGK